MLSLCPFDISVGVGAFVIGLSQISSFFSRINVGLALSLVKLLLSSWKIYMCNLVTWYTNK